MAHLTKPANLKEISSVQERKDMTESLWDVMAEFIDTDSPINPSCLMVDPRTGDEITIADAFRLVRLSKY